MSSRALRNIAVSLGLLLSARPYCALAQSGLLSGINYAEFRYDATMTDVEIYVSISPANLSLHSAGKAATTDGRLVSVVELRYRLKNLAADSTFYITDSVPIEAADSQSAHDASTFVTVTRLLFKPGDYLATVFATQGDSGTASDSAEMLIKVRPLSDKSLSISGVELCSDISASASKDDPYYKNTLHVVPNPKAVYGMGMPVVSYYGEVYGLGKLNDTTEYAVSWNVMDTYGRVVKKSVTLKSGSASDVVEVGSINISDLPSGKFALELAVADSIDRKTASSSSYFFVYNPYVKQPVIASAQRVNVFASPFFTMGEQDLDAIFHAANYLETPQQTSEYKKLTTIDGKRRFLAEFWAAPGRNGDSSGFNTWPRFEARLKYANVNFKTAFKPGWMTDRGRVYIDYGAPDEIDRHPNSANNKPYQIWSYNSRNGGGIFVFVDRTGFNDYELIHSTMRGEVSDPDWQRYVQMQQ